MLISPETCLKAIVAWPLFPSVSLVVILGVRAITPQPEPLITIFSTITIPDLETKRNQDFDFGFRSFVERLSWRKIGSLAGKARQFIQSVLNLKTKTGLGWCDLLASG